MRIISGVTADARTRGQRHCRSKVSRRYSVACGTRYLDVCAVQRIFTLPCMIKVPRLPTSCGMAGFALPAESAFVNVFLVVTFGANPGRILVCRREMTSLTLRTRMGPGQLEFRFVVIVRNARPFLLVVTGLALTTQLPFVRVILFVTGQTIHGQRFGTFFDV